ncbi:MAG: translation initiation factor IF-2 [Bacilli bacterium]|nr:translation initiation factor IF-2 [Bacilli bacterium]
MSILEYAMDVNRDVSDIISLCESLNIKKTSEDDLLTDDEIIMLDLELDSLKENVNPDYEIDEELESKVDNLVSKIDMNLDSVSTKKEKVKSKVDNKNDVKAKNNYQKGRKEIYKHREKLGDNKSEDDVIIYHEKMTPATLAGILKVSPTEIVKKLFNLGVMANVNQTLNFDTVELLLLDYKKKLKKEESVDKSNFEKYEIIDNPEDLEPRPPVITIMGHVDHGKTTLLDTIRQSSVAEGEAGGITQAIGAYQVVVNGKKVTFIDTPGHEAFTEMRSRGASVTDIVVIIVAANDGVMPQTKEAIDHAKAAGVPIVVAINKVDLPDANVNRVLTELTEYGLVPESFGGDIVTCNISAKTGDGVKELLETLLLVSEMADLKANPNRYATGTVIEARGDQKVGSIVTLLVQSGTLRLGDPVVIGTSYGKIRTLKDDKGNNITTALPSTPVEVTGINVLPRAGDKFMAFETEKEARSISIERGERSREADTNKAGMSLDDLFSMVEAGEKEINVVLKTDVKGSEEAVKQSLSKINIEGVWVNVIRSGVGAITESDIVLASASNAIIIGFNVRPNSKIVDFAKEKNVEIRLYNIIYKVVEEMEDAIRGMLDPVFEEVVTGEAEVRQIFKFSKIGNIAGSHVVKGTIKNQSDARVVRDGVVIYTGRIGSLQREKDSVREVKNGYDCGITIESFQDIKEGDVIETFEQVEVKK